MNNRIDATFTSDQQKAAETALDALEAALPFLYDLSPDERQTIYKLGDKSRTFVDTALVVAQTHPDAMPGSFDAEEFEADLALFRATEGVYARLRNLFERLDDTRMLAGSEAIGAARAVYYYTKGHPGAAELNEAAKALGRRYSRRSRGGDAPADPHP